MPRLLDDEQHREERTSVETTGQMRRWRRKRNTRDFLFFYKRGDAAVKDIIPAVTVADLNHVRERGLHEMQNRVTSLDRGRG